LARKPGVWYPLAFSPAVTLRKERALLKDTGSASGVLSRRSFLATAGSLAVAGAASSQQRIVLTPEVPANDPTRSNVLVLLLDSLRADHLSIDNYLRPTSPFIDSIAREGFQFAETISPSSYTRESVSAIFTGMNPSESGSVGWSARPGRTTTLAQAFKSAGYRTGLFTDTAMLGHAAYHAGFEKRHFESRRGMPSGLGPELSRHAAAFAAADPDRPFFAYVHYIDPHGPYDPPRELLLRMAGAVHPNPARIYKDVRQNLEQMKVAGFGPGEARFDDMVARYDAEIAHVDMAIAQVFDALEKSGTLDNTIVVITADHGEEFLDHGFVEHAWQLYRESTRVPLLFWNPNRIAPGRTEQRVALANLYPTLLSLAGIPVPTSASGESLFETTGTKLSPRVSDQPIVSELLIQSRNMVRTMIVGEWKYLAALRWHAPHQLAGIVRGSGPLERKIETGELPAIDIFQLPVHEELYHIGFDPLEQRNLADSEPEEMDRFRAEMACYYDRCRLTNPIQQGRPPKQEVAPSQEEIEAMEALGYI